MKQDDGTISNRREFLIAVGTAAAAISVTGSLLSGCKQQSSRKDGTTAAAVATLDVTKPEFAMLSKAGGMVKIPDPADPDRPIIVFRRTADAVVAFSSRCPHAGCEVALPDAGKVICPCHDSIFDDRGNFISGPAKGPLKRFTARLDGAVITVML